MQFVPLFFDRRDAGRRLTKLLKPEYGGRSEVTVVAVMRGGLIVGQEVARGLGVGLQALPAQKIRVPFHPRLAMGALAGNGVRVLNGDVIESMRISARQLDQATELSRRQLRWTREMARGFEEPLRGRTVLLVDDGMTTGATIRAAIRCVERDEPEAIVVGIPVGTPEVCEEIEGRVARVCCVAEVLEMYSIAQAYRSFNPVADDEVRHVLGSLERARSTA